MKNNLSPLTSHLSPFTFLLLLFVLPLTLSAQALHHDRPAPNRDITELVSDLSSAQKQKLDAITSESSQRLDPLRQRHQAVRDSIRNLMEREGDQSALLNPLFDREAKLQAAISREMYATKVRMDQVLTKEQRQQLRQSMKKRRPEGRQSTPKLKKK